MNITHIIFSLQIGGAENIMIDIINYQVELGNKVNLLIINNQINQELLNKIDKKVNIIMINRKEGSKNPLFILKLYFYLYKYKSQVIHSHNKSVIKLLSLVKTKKVLTVHDTGSGDYLLNYYDEVFAISKAVQNDILKRTKINSTLIYNGIISSKINSSKIKKEKKIFKIVQVGRLVHDIKGQDLLIRAINILKFKFGLSNITCHLIGEGSSLEYLKELTRELNLEDNVKFLGPKSRDYIYENLCNYDLLVQPSRHEGFGLTIAEAMLAKIPVLVSDIEGPMELINDGEFGFYFKKEDITDLSYKLNQIINSSRDENFLINTYNYAKKFYDISSTVKKYLTSYEN